MFDIFGQLFDTHVWVRVCANLMTASACAAAMLVIGRRFKRWGELGPFLAAVVGVAGLEHVIAAAQPWEAWPGLSALLQMTMPVVSWGAVVALVRKVPVGGGGNEGVALNNELHREVEERKRIEAHAQKLNQDLTSRVRELEILLDMLPVGIGIAADEKCRDIRTNRAFSEMLGIRHGTNASLSAPEEEAPAGFKVYTEGKEMSPEELPMQRAAREGIVIRDLEELILRDDGTRLDLICHAAPILDDGGKCRGAIGVFYDITQRKAAEDRLRDSLQEKQVLLHEVHHRVKNNLQFIISLLRLQSGEVNDPRLNEVLEAMRGRVHAMALVHEKLYRAEDFSHLDYASYLRDLVAGVTRTMSRRAANVQVSVVSSETGLDTNAAVPVGFIVNELVTNSLKYAFADDRPGRLEVELRGTREEGYRLTVRDNGVGLPADLNPQTAQTMGLRLVSMLVRQVGGTMVLSRDGGTEFAISFTPRQAH